MRQKIFLLFALLCTIAQGAWAATRTYEYPTKTKPAFEASYDGKSNVVIINTAAELAYITAYFSEDSGYKVDGKSKDWSELNYYLNADINMGNSYSWLPLGRESYWVTEYEGTFWGNGHTITYMIRGLDEENQGLFSTIHKNGKVYDVNVVCDIYTEEDYVGGIAGQNYGLIQNCTVTANIESNEDFVGGIAGENYGLIENCTVTANIESNHDDVGGIVGHNLDTGTVKGCHVTGLVKGTGSAIRIGGIAGRNNHDIDGAGHPYYGTITNCWVEADVSSECTEYAARLGGICGLNFANVSYCCMTGNVSHASGNSEVGAIAGSSDRSDHDVSNCTFYGILTNNYNQKNIYVGDKGDTMENMYNTFNQAEYDDAVSKGHSLYAYAIRNVFALSVTTTGTGTVTVSDFNAETIDYDKVPTGHWIYVNITSGVVVGVIAKDADGNDVEVTRYHQYGDNYYMFPMPRSNVSVTVNFTTQQGDGSEENPYVISTAEEWKAFATDVNDNGKSFEGKFVMLGGDFTLGSYSTVGNGFGFINAFKGTLDGNGHTITISNTPPFGHVMDATIKNLNIAGDATLSSWSGCIVQHWNGTLNLINCRVSVNVNCLGDQYFGGLAGQMYIPGSGASTNPNTVIIDGCVFDGSFNSTVTNEYRAHDCSGFVGDAGTGGTVIIRNSILKPGSVGEGILSNTFAYMSSGTPTIENSYYVAADNLPANQGTQARTVSAGADVTLSGLGEAATTYGSNGITAYAHGISYGGTNYAGGGESVSLTLRHGSKTGYTFGGYTASAGTISGTTLTMPDADVTIGAAWTRFLDGTGSDDDPYVIRTTDEWNIFASSVNSGTGFSGEVVKLTSSISVSTMAGTSSNQFRGTFDGDGQTLTFTKGTSAEPFAEEYCAPFRHVRNAVIKNLHVDGTIYTSAKKAAGFVGESHHNLSIIGCRSSIAINSSTVTGNDDHDGTHGGLVSTLSGENNTVTIDGCVFDGSFATTNGTINCGGFIGWGVYNKPTIKNSLMKPGSVAANMLKSTFARWYTDKEGIYEPTIDNCYYVATDNLPTNQGMVPDILTSIPDDLGDLVNDFGMVKAYENGLLYDGTYYMNASLRLGGAGTEEEPYLIYNVDQLNLLASIVSSGKSTYQGKYVKLMNDIAFSHTTDWNDAGSTENNFNPIGGNYRPFCGDFDGDGHTISGIRIYKGTSGDESSYQGLFGSVGDGANIHDIILADASITGKSYVGGIAGCNNGGTITRCHATASVAICAKVYGCFFHGGIVGLNKGTVSNCTSAVTLTYSQKNNTYDFGGICGDNGDTGTLSDNLAIGVVVPAVNGEYGAICGYKSYDTTMLRNYYTACTVAGRENATGVGCNNADRTSDDGAVPALRDNADNTNAIALMAALPTTVAGQPVTYPVVLNGRTLYKDGAWNTLCLPFSLSAAQIAAHADFAGATLMTLDVTQKNGFNTEDGTLYLWFKTATEIEAGVPYLVKWTSGDDISNPVFQGVTISNSTVQTVESETTGLEIVQMVGTYSPVSVIADDKSILFLGDANTLYYSSIDRQIRSCRAYFSVPYVKGHPEAKARAFALNFDGEETTGILEVSAKSNEVKDDVWYLLDGVRLSGKPTQRGMYINKGKKVLVK